MSTPNADEVKSLAVMGFGTMGHTWSTALLLGGLDVYVYEADKKVVEKNRDRVKGYLESLKKKGKWDGDVEATFSKLNVLSNESDLASCGAPVLLEVIFEDLALKCETYKRLGEVMPAETMFWTNTSCLDVERMGEASGRPGTIPRHPRNESRPPHERSRSRSPPQTGPRCAELLAFYVEARQQRPFRNQ